MPERKTNLTSAIGWSKPDEINVHGLDLPSEILGHVNLGDMAFMQVTGRRPDARESVVFNAIAVTLVEHGITPSALVARLTYMGAPESLQAAVAAGLCGLGTVFVGSMEGAARMLYAALPPDQTGRGADLAAIAARVVAEHRAAGRIVSGLGHPVHKPEDPRTPRLFEIAAQNGKSGDYVRLIQLIQKEAEAASGKSLPINATGAIGAICCEFAFPEEIIRGFGVMTRAIGLVGHILEETRDPMAYEIWQRTEEEVLANSQN
ncbi:citryl-CoA lyase [Pseudooceanicola aestuarii]|uniref:citryl-CoA lyase n=1 Tax=Pseudooceanicola aestuarii TaxID=2697319 RepID=UPI001953EF3E|nr:citryl-CoA lyase [Pseudooceanicola aestuarii]